MVKEDSLLSVKNRKKVICIRISELIEFFWGVFKALNTDLFVLFINNSKLDALCTSFNGVKRRK